jgi:putative protease
MADVGCRNTVFGAEAQTDPDALAQWREAGVSHFRIEMVHQSNAQTVGLIAAFSRFLVGEIDPTELGRQLDAFSDHGTTEGSLFVPQGFKQLVQLQG